MSKTVAGPTQAAPIPNATGKLEASEIKEVQPTESKEEFVQITIPAADLYDHGHPGVQLNRHKFEPGKTYLVRKDVAKEITMRLHMFDREQVRLLRPNADRRSINEVNKGSSWTSRGGGTVGDLDNGLGNAGASDEVIYTVDF